MSGTVHEIFGYRADDNSPQAIASALSLHCPYLGTTCQKKLSDHTVSGVCAIKPMTTAPVICCPIRMYAENYRVLRDVADRAFTVGLDLVPGGTARDRARTGRKRVVAVFGHGWGGELRLPKRGKGGNYFVDWVLALISPSGDLIEFVAIEVQTIDTTGNYRASRSALLNPARKVVRSEVGLNWENVNKRIIPQLIYKGQVLQRETLCKKGLFFIIPTPVYGHIVDRLGGEAGLIKYQRQPAAITFLAYDYVADPVSKGQTVPLELQVEHTTTVYKLQERFGNITLPEPDVYARAIRQALED